jgi:hypothetical protein
MLLTLEVEEKRNVVLQFLSQMKLRRTVASKNCILLRTSTTFSKPFFLFVLSFSLYQFHLFYVFRMTYRE